MCHTCVSLSDAWTRVAQAQEATSGGTTPTKPPRPLLSCSAVESQSHTPKNADAQRANWMESRMVLLEGQVAFYTFLFFYFMHFLFFYIVRVISDTRADASAMRSRTTDCGEDGYTHARTHTHTHSLSLSFMRTLSVSPLSLFFFSLPVVCLSLARSLSLCVCVCVCVRVCVCACVRIFPQTPHHPDPFLSLLRSLPPPAVKSLSSLC